MSVVDEVMGADEPGFSNTTTLVNGAQVFTPRTVFKSILDVVVGLTTTPQATISHYTVGDGTLVYHMFYGKSGMSLTDVLATAYRNVFMWIRPQGPNDLYYEPYQDRDAALAKLTHVLHDLVGSAANELMFAEYRDERVLEINRGDESIVIDIRRSYDRATDRLTTMIISLPERYAQISADELFEDNVTTTIQKTPAFIDPGDFMPGVWTIDPNNDSA